MRPSGRTRADNTLDDVTDSLPTWDFIKSEMDRGEDVEIGIKWNGRGGHIIVATGYMEDGSGNKYLWFKHDRDQAREGGTIQEFDRIEVGEDGTLWLARKQAWIRHVVSESPGEPFVAEIQIDLLNGWNMVSNPYELPLFVPEDIVPSFFAPAYTYNTLEGVYNAADTILQGPGFWLLMPEDTVVSLSGECLADSILIDLQVGWNMIGLPNWAVMCSDLSGYDELLLPVYLYNPETNAYDDIECMEPGKSYWILATEPVTLIFIRP